MIPQLETHFLSKLIKINVAGFLFLFLTGCQGTASAPSVPPPRNIFLTAVGALLFLVVFFYMGFKAFIERHTSAKELSKAERRTRIAGFLIGALSAILLIAIDAAPGPISSLGILAFFPWYILIIMSVIFGFGLAVVSKLVARYRPTSGTGFMLMVVTFISAAGLYLILFAGGLQSKVLAAILPVFIGLLLFRMLFPTRQTSHNEKGAKRSKMVKNYDANNKNVG